MRAILLALSFAFPITLAAAVPAPDREVTDPASISSPVNADAAPVPIEDLVLSRGIRDVAWSVDGRYVFIATNLSGRYNIWRVDAGGSWPVQLTVSDDAQTGLNPSPDGRSLLFTQEAGGDGDSDLYSVPVAGGPVAGLTATPASAENNPRHSPDGRSIALEIRAKDSAVTSIAVLDLETKAVRNLMDETAAKHDWFIAGWMPDGQSIIANRINRGATEASVWRISVTGGRAEPVIAPEANVIAWATSVSPDGRRLAISSNAATGQYRAGILDLTTKRLLWLRSTPWEQMSGSFSPDGRGMLALTNEDGRSVLALVDVTTGGERRLGLPPGYNAEASSLNGPFAPDARRLLAQHSGANTPLDVWVVDLATGRSSPLTQLSLASLNPERLPRSQIVTYGSFDGTLISAVLTIPFNLRRDGSNAAVVVAHGSGGQAEDRFDRIAAALASRGYFVIRPNFRGSPGYGRAFQMANVRDLGGGDLKDTLAARDFLVATGYVDPRKVGITGSSYGGTMTLMALTRAPEAFAAGVQWFGVFNRRTQYESANAEEKQWLVSMLGDPVKDKAAYDAASPASYVQNVKAPVLSLQGEDDTIVPRSQAEELDKALRSRGIVTETIFYPGEGHGFEKTENQADALRRTVAWFDRYLKGKKPAAGR